MEFEITYVNPSRANKTVNESYFKDSTAFTSVLELEVGQTIINRYWSAGYHKIKRLA